MTRAAFIVSKQPFGRRQDGETQLTNVLIEAASQVCELTVIALADEPALARPPVKVIEVPKPKLALSRLAIESLARRRSLIHCRFAPPELRRSLEAIDADVFLARRVYMAQAAIDAERVAPRDRLVVLVDALESMVLAMRRSSLAPLVKLEARRTRRDEIRCIRCASSVACFSEAEADELPELLAGRPRLDLVLPSAPEPAELDSPVAVFVGDRTWLPNAAALAKLLDLWPRIAQRVAGARLLIVGRPGPGEAAPREPGIERVGFVEDLDAVWSRAGLLLAPVTIGGGVRVKVLDAARRGVPVVGTPAAIGSVGRYLPLTARGSDEEFIADATELLSDSRVRRERGRELYQANRDLTVSGFVERQVATLLTRPSVGPSAPPNPERAGAV